MSQKSVSCLGCCLFWWAASCSTPSTDTVTRWEAKEGARRAKAETAESGGQTGGSVGTGGSTSTGGSIGTGGSGTGGSASGGHGGTTATGGTIGSGGRGGSGTGGSSSGGTVGTGGSGTGGNGSGGTGTGGASSGGTTGRGGMTGTGGTSTGGTPGANQPPPITNGMAGWASRYWDCCKPACGWKANVSHGNPMMSCDMSNNSLGGSYDTKNWVRERRDRLHVLERRPLAGGAARWPTASRRPRAATIPAVAAISCNSPARTTPAAITRAWPALSGKTMIVQVINNGGVQSHPVRHLDSRRWRRRPQRVLEAVGRRDRSGIAVRRLPQRMQRRLELRPAEMSGRLRQSASQLLSGCMWFLDWFGGSTTPTSPIRRSPARPR